MSGVFEVEHPLIACHLTRLRDKSTPPAEFRAHRESAGVARWRTKRSRICGPNR